ncbi:MAG: hypothetical protein NVSMB46_01800 [Candidatus Saccharimonadales bacterium]
MTETKNYSNRLPERLLFTSKLKIISAEIIRHVIESDKLSDKGKEYTKKNGWLPFKNQPQSLNSPILGADQVIFDTLGYSDGFSENPTKNGFTICMYLLKHGKPFVIESDKAIVEKLGIRHKRPSNDYVIHANPEMPPTAVSIDLLEYAAKESDFFNLRAMTLVMSELGSMAVHQLTDEECLSITTYLSSRLSDDCIEYSEIKQMDSGLLL